EFRRVLFRSLFSFFLNIIVTYLLPFTKFFLDIIDNSCQFLILQKGEAGHTLFVKNTIYRTFTFAAVQQKIDKSIVVLYPRSILQRGKSTFNPKTIFFMT